MIRLFRVFLLEALLSSALLSIQGVGAEIEGTVRNSYGVLTEEIQPVRLFLAPRFDYGSSFGIAGVEMTPDISFGGELGVRVSRHLMFHLFYESGSQNVMAPGIGPVSEYQWSQKTLGTGARVFVLESELWIHPYFGGGLSGSQGSLGSRAPVFISGEVAAPESKYHQLSGFGEVGAEIGLTQALVATFQVKVSGVISSAGTDESALTPEMRDRGNSVSRSTSYLLGAGVGIYF